MKRIVIIDHFSQAPQETGNNRFIYLADLLSKNNYEVELITSSFQHTAKKQRRIPQQLLKQLPYKFTMLFEPDYPRNVCLKRFHSHFVFGRNLKVYLLKMKKPDLVYIAVPSLDVGTRAAKYCKKRKIPFIVDIQDLWPEAFNLVFDIPGLSNLVFCPMARQVDYIYAQADKIIAVSETYKRRGLQANHKDKHGLCVYLGTDLEGFDTNADKKIVEKPMDEIWIVYVGTLGHSYNIEIIIEALDMIPERLINKTVFKVLGDGPYIEHFKTYAKNRKGKVDFLGRLTYSEMTAYLKKSDIAVNPIVKGAAQSIINKHADYAAAGLPVVNTQECREYRNLLEAYKCGINCEVGSAEQVAKALQEMIENPEKRKQMGANSRWMAEERFDRRNTYQQMVRVIEDLVR